MISTVPNSKSEYTKFLLKDNDQDCIIDVIFSMHDSSGSAESDINKWFLNNHEWITSIAISIQYKRGHFILRFPETSKISDRCRAYNLIIDSQRHGESFRLLIDKYN